MNRLKIKDGSLHLKIYQLLHQPLFFLEENPKNRHLKKVYPSNLCRYFWSIIFALIFLPVFYLVMLTGVLVFGPPILLGVGVFLGIRWIVRKIKNWNKKRYLKLAAEGKIRPVAPKEPSLIAEYFKARKKKYCPIIEVETEDGVYVGGRRQAKSTL